MTEERKLTEAEEAILAEAKPETEAEAIAALSAADEKKSEEQLYNEMFDESKKKKPVRQCRSCKHRPETVCFIHQIVKNANESCSRWSD